MVFLLKHDVIFVKSNCYPSTMACRRRKLFCSRSRFPYIAPRLLIRLTLSLALICLVLFSVSLLSIGRVANASKFEYFHNYDMKARDFSCMGSRSPVECVFMMKGKDEAFDKCLSLVLCGGFVISNEAGVGGRFITWFKIRVFSGVKEYLEPSPKLSVFALKPLPPIFGAGKGMWDGNGVWLGPPPRSAFLADVGRMDVVRDAMRHAWAGYEQYAWGQDELRPVTNVGSNWLGMGATIIDSLDTLWIMGMKSEFTRAREWVATNFAINATGETSVFETTIRCLGGLVAAFELSGDEVFLEVAVSVADKLLPAFDTKSGYPLAHVDLSDHQRKATRGRRRQNVALAEIGSIQLEFKALSLHTGDPKYYDRTHAVYNKLEQIIPKDGLCPIFLNPNSGGFSGTRVSLGAMGDSYYEYLIKLYLYSGRSQPQYLRMYNKSLTGILSKLVFQSSHSNLTYVAEMQHGSPVHKMDHLACFVPGMLGIGAMDSPDPQHAIRVARGITETCFEMYARQASGVAPEFVKFKVPDFVNGAKYNQLRPEALESMFVMFRLTGDPIYREWGWKIFLAFESSSKTSSGYSGLTDVTKGAGSGTAKDDTQPSFFLAETLKYAYLLFAGGDEFPIDEYVFNAEARPFKIP